jgi:arsenate reductase
LRNVLFLCTGNSARSIRAVVMANHIGRDRLRAFSAGSHPTGRVIPLALEALGEMGFVAPEVRSKAWDEFSRAGAPPIDIVITVCDQAAGESCPIFPGKPLKAHWGVADPAAVRGSEEEKRAAFRHAATILRGRIELLASLPLERLDRSALQASLEEAARQ